MLEQLQRNKNVKDLLVIGYGGTKLLDWVGHSSFSNLSSSEA